METSIKMMRELINFLNYHTDLYNSGHPEITDKEWDNKYFMLQDLEKITGVIYPDSPTHHIVYETKSELEEFAHGEFPMLSLNKTKDLQTAKEFVEKGQRVIISTKMDGLSCKLIYKNGQLISAATRGDGEIGEDITHNAKVISNIPLFLPATAPETVIVTGEIICDDTCFDEFAAEYKNQRNFAAGSIRLLSSEESSKRYLSFIAWDYVNSDDKYFGMRLNYLQDLGFTTVPTIACDNADTLENAISFIREQSRALGYPLDGVVLRYDDIDYGNQLGMTAHHPCHSLAFKFEDEIVDSILWDIVYEPSRNGCMTPVAVFKPVDLLGSTISRASMFNVSIMTRLLGKHPWVGQAIKVIKSNMIIPQIIWAERRDETIIKNNINMDMICPYCGEPLEIYTSETGIDTLMCVNEKCTCRLENQLDYFCGKTGMDINGLSKATLNKLITWGWVSCRLDIYSLSFYRDEWIKQTGFGAKSVDNILNAIEASKDVDYPHFLAALGIPLIGLNVAKDLFKSSNANWDEFRQLVDNHYDFSELDGFGEAKTNSLLNYDYKEADMLAKLMRFKSSEMPSTTSKNYTVCITGKLNYGSRTEFKAYLEREGIKVTDSVSGKTNYLIANTPETSAKYKKAETLGIPIITEKNFLDLMASF